MSANRHSGTYILLLNSTKSRSAYVWSIFFPNTLAMLKIVKINGKVALVDYDLCQEQSPNSVAYAEYFSDMSPVDILTAMMYVTTVETTSCSEYMRMTMEMLGRDFDSKSMVLNAQKNKNVVLLLDHTNLRSEDTRGLPPLQELELFGRILVFKDFASEA